MAVAPERARRVHLAVLAAAVALLLAGLALVATPGQAAARLLVLLGFVALLGLEVWLRTAPRGAPRAAGAAPAAEAWAPAAAEQVTIRCKQCGEVFAVDDTGARPLVAACPYCGKSGTVRGR